MFYINPRTMDKEQWLSTHAIPTDRATVEQFTDFTGPQLPAVWVHNGQFTAAGVAPDKAELDRWFRDPEDTRLRQFFLVPKEALFALHPELKEALDGTE